MRSFKKISDAITGHTGEPKYYGGNFGLLMQLKNLILKDAIMDSPFEGGQGDVKPLLCLQIK